MEKKEIFKDGIKEMEYIKLEKGEQICFYKHYNGDENNKETMFISSNLKNEFQIDYSYDGKRILSVCIYNGKDYIGLIGLCHSYEVKVG